MTGADNEDLLREIIALWITIRGPSFAKSVMEKYKLAVKKSSEKSKGLCTRLFTEHMYVFVVHVYSCKFFVSIIQTFFIFSFSVAS